MLTEKDKQLWNCKYVELRTMIRPACIIITILFFCLCLYELFMLCFTPGLLLILACEEIAKDSQRK